jgi:hypothetical protein
MMSSRIREILKKQSSDLIAHHGKNTGPHEPSNPIEQNFHQGISDGTNSQLHF